MDYEFLSAQTSFSQLEMSFVVFFFMQKKKLTFKPMQTKKKCHRKSF